MDNPISNIQTTETTKKVYVPPSIVMLGNINDLVKANSNHKLGVLNDDDTNSGS